MQLHHQAAQVKRVLEGNKIKTLYHFTAIGNLTWIAKYRCLLSKGMLEQEGIFDEIETGGNELSLNLDRELGNWDKVHLYFCPNTPMAYGKQGEAHAVYILIKPDIALWQGVLFTDTNATRKREGGHQREQGVEGLKLVDFETIRATIDGGPKPWDRTWHRNVQAEILVPDRIPLEYVDHIAFISPASLEEGKRLWGNGEHPPFEINYSLFHSGFPYVKEVILTTQEVNANTIESAKFIDKREFTVGRDSKITLLINLKAVPGLQANVLWTTRDGKIIVEDNIEFEKEGDYWHWPAIKTAKLGIGSYFVEYRLGDIRWVKIPFEIRR